MPTDRPSADIPDTIAGELRTLNAHLPRKRKALGALLAEKRPHVELSDGNLHFFRRKELEYLAGMLYENERDTFMLPMLFEVSSDTGDVVIRPAGGVEEKVLGAVLKMPVTAREGKITLYRPQVSAIRHMLKTATQYVFY